MRTAVEAPSCGVPYCSRASNTRAVLPPGRWIGAGASG